MLVGCFCIITVMFPMALQRMGCVGPTLFLLYRRWTGGPERCWATQTTQLELGVVTFSFFLFNNSLAIFFDRRPRGMVSLWGEHPSVLISLSRLPPLPLSVASARAPLCPWAASCVTSLLGPSLAASFVCQCRPLLQRAGTAAGKACWSGLVGELEGSVPLGVAWAWGKRLLVGTLWL